MSTPTTPQWALTISHAHGVDAFLADTKDEALDHLHGYVTEWWDDEVTEPIPADRDEAIERYFWIVDAEDYTLAEVAPTAKTFRTTGEAAAAARDRMRAAQREARDTALVDWTTEFAQNLRAEFPNLPTVATIGIGFHDDVEGWYTTVDTVTFADGSDHGGLGDDIADDLTELVRATNSFWTWADVVHDDPDADHMHGINGHVEPVPINDPGPDGHDDPADDPAPASAPAWTLDLAEEYRDTYPNQTVTAVRVAPTTEGPRIVEARTADGGKTTGGVCAVGNDAILEHPSFLAWAATVAIGPNGAWTTLPPHGQNGPGPTPPTAPDDDEVCCAECGQPMITTDDGITHHFGGPVGLDDIDHDTDADHVAIPDTAHAPASPAAPTGKARKKAVKAIKAAFPNLTHQQAVNVVDGADTTTIPPAARPDVTAVIAGHTGPVTVTSVAAMLRLLRADATTRINGPTITVTGDHTELVASHTDWSTVAVGRTRRTTGLPAMGNGPLAAAAAILRIVTTPA